MVTNFYRTPHKLSNKLPAFSSAIAFLPDRFSQEKKKKTLFFKNLKLTRTPFFLFLNNHDHDPTLTHHQLIVWMGVHHAPSSACVMLNPDKVM
jgi:hypothetical protein